MRKLVYLCFCVALMMGVGCALTDYALMTPQNKSHGLVGCESNDRIANAQQTIEAQTRDLLYTTTFGGPSVGGSCTTGFDPGVSLNFVSSQDARDWNRFNANWCFFGETQVFDGFNFIPALIGLFALSEVFSRLEDEGIPKKYRRRAVAVAH